MWVLGEIVKLQILINRPGAETEILHFWKRRVMGVQLVHGQRDLFLLFHRCFHSQGGRAAWIRRWGKGSLEVRGAGGSIQVPVTRWPPSWPIWLVESMVEMAWPTLSLICADLRKNCSPSYSSPSLQLTWTAKDFSPELGSVWLCTCCWQLLPKFLLVAQM